jgi:hypothetical protein
MQVKTTVICRNHRIVGTLDAPKIKNRVGRMHFGLLALLNYPKLANSPIGFKKNVIMLENVEITTHDGERIAKAPRVCLKPEQILAAFEHATKEHVFFDPKQQRERFGLSRQTFQSRDGFEVEGDFTGEINDIAVEKGSGFISLANARVRAVNPITDKVYLPFIAINHSAFKESGVESRAALDQATYLAKCG